MWRTVGDDDDAPAPGKPDAAKVKKPKLPKDAPRDFRRFVSCKRDAVELKAGKLDWLPVDLLADPQVGFEEDPAKPGTVKMKVSAGGAGAGSFTVPISVSDGQLAADTTGLPIGGQAVQDWVKDLNGWLQSKGKQLDALKVKDGKLALAKVARAGAAGKEGGIKLGAGSRWGVAPGHLLPHWEKAGAGALMMGVTLASVLTMNIGDETKTIVSGSRPAVVAGAYCVHHGETSEIEARFLTAGVPNGDMVKAYLTKLPEGRRVFGRGVARNGYIAVHVDVTGLGPSRYELKPLLDLKLGLRLDWEYPRPRVEVTPDDTSCPDEQALRAQLTGGGTGGAGQPMTVPGFVAYQYGVKHPPVEEEPVNPFTGQLVEGLSFNTTCASTSYLALGSYLRFDWTGPTGQFSAYGEVREQGYVKAYGGIFKFGDYRLTGAYEVDPARPSFERAIMLLPGMTMPYAVDARDRPCTTDDLPPGMLLGVPVDEGRDGGGYEAGPPTRIAMLETDGAPWSLAVGAGLDLLVLGGLSYDRSRRRRLDLGAGADGETMRPFWFA